MNNNVSAIGIVFFTLMMILVIKKAGLAQALLTAGWVIGGLVVIILIIGLISDIARKIEDKRNERLRNNNK